MSKKRQIRFDVTLYFLGGTQTNATFDSRRKVVNFTSEQFDKEVIIGGVCRIRYTRSFSNTFDFDSYKQFKEVLAISLEKELLDEYC